MVIADTFTMCLLLHKVSSEAKWWNIRLKDEVTSCITALVVGQLQSCFKQWYHLYVKHMNTVLWSKPTSQYVSKSSTTLVLLYQNQKNKMAWWSIGLAPNRRRRSLGFDSQLACSCLTTVGKLFTPNCLDVDSLRYSMASLNNVYLYLSEKCHMFVTAWKNEFSVCLNAFSERLLTCRVGTNE